MSFSSCIYSLGLNNGSSVPSTITASFSVRISGSKIVGKQPQNVYLNLPFKHLEVRWFSDPLLLCRASPTSLRGVTCKLTRPPSNPSTFQPEIYLETPLKAQRRGLPAARLPTRGLINLPARFVTDVRLKMAQARRRTRLHVQLWLCMGLKLTR